ncbi:Protein FAR1-RELATED SEQUENCE 5 [Linum grandiflorum]
MGGKKHKAVVTDGDLAMLNAIKEVFPEAVNRRCAWHIRKNLKSLHFKKEVIDDWYRFVCRNYDETLFKEKWKGFLQKHSLEDSQQIRNLYEKRTQWAHTYLRHMYLAGMKTTSRCKGLNSQIKTYLSNRHTLFEFFFSFLRRTRNLREAELKLDFETLCTLPLMSNLHSKASRVEAFKKFRDEMHRSADCIQPQVVEHEDVKTYTVMQTDAKDYKWKVEYDVKNGDMKCSSFKFRSTGLPCSHMIFVLKQENHDLIPSLVLPIMSRNPKKCLIVERADEYDVEHSATLRYGVLQNIALAIVSLGSEDCNTFRSILPALTDVYNKIKNDKSSNAASDDVPVDSSTPGEFDGILNPNEIAPKDAPKREDGQGTLKRRRTWRRPEKNRGSVKLAGCLDTIGQLARWRQIPTSI